MGQSACVDEQQISRFSYTGLVQLGTRPTVSRFHFDQHDRIFLACMRLQNFDKNYKRHGLERFYAKDSSLTQRDKPIRVSTIHPHIINECEFLGSAAKRWYGRDSVNWRPTFEKEKSLHL